MFKDLGTKIYFLIMGPMYRRLSRDVSLRMQELARVQMEFQERWSATMADELIALSVKANVPESDFDPLPHKYSVADIIETAARIHKSQDIVALSRELKMPINELITIYMKYGDVCRIGIARMLEMEDQMRTLKSFTEKLEDQTAAIQFKTDITSQR